MKPEWKQSCRNRSEESSASCYDFTRLSEALESCGTESSNIVKSIATVADSGASTAAQSAGKSLYELKEISEALNHVEKNLKQVKRLKVKKRRKGMQRKQRMNIQAFEDLDDPIANQFCQELLFTGVILNHASTVVS